MPSDAENFIAKNRRLIRNRQGRFQEVDAGRSRAISFAASILTASIELRLFERSTGSQIVVDHGDESKGFGRGTFGDDKGEWVEIPDAAESGVLLQAGREQIADILDGVDHTFETIEYGYDGTDATPSDTGVLTPSNLGPTQPSKSKPNATTSSLSVRYGSIESVSDESEAVDFEFVVATEDGPIIRTTASATVDDTSEIRAVVDVTIEGLGKGNAVIPETAESSVRDIIHDEGVGITISEWAIGRSGNLNDSSTSLSDEVGRVPAETTRESIRTIIESGRVDAADFDESDIPFDAAEAGVFFDDGTILWATPLREFEVGAETVFNVDTVIQVK